MAFSFESETQNDTLIKVNRILFSRYVELKQNSMSNIVVYSSTMIHFLHAVPIYFI